MNGEDGKIIIGTEVDNKGFEKGIDEVKETIKENNAVIKIKTNSDEIKKQIEELNKEIKEFNSRQHWETTGAGEDVLLDDFTEEERKRFHEIALLRENLYAEYLETSGILEEIMNRPEIQTEDIKKANNEIGETQKKLYEIIDLMEEYKLMSKEPVKSNETLQNIELIKQKIIETKKELEQITGQKFYISGFEDLQETQLQLNNIGKKTTNLIKKIARWGLALFGIRSAYSFIRQMISQATQQNEELAKKMQYVKSALGSAFQPIAKVVVDLIYKIIVGIGALIKLITGKNIFANVSKDLNKTLAGWDEATTLGGRGNLANGLLGGNLDIANEVEKAGSKLKEWFTRKPTKAEIMGVLNTIIYPWKMAFNWIYDNYKTFIKKMVDELEPLWRPIWEEMKKEFTPAINFMKDTWNQFLVYLKPVKTKINEILQPMKDGWKQMVDQFLKPLWLEFYNSLPQPVQDALNRIWNAFKKVYNDIAFYLNNIGIKVAYITDETETEAKNAGKEVKKEVQDVSKSIDKLSNKTININTNNTQINKLKNTLKDIYDYVYYLSGGVTITYSTTKAKKQGAKGLIYYPKLASGGIINQPGRGVMYKGANIAERGAEAVLPLTDSQQMDLLGQSIAKHMTINATIPVYAYNREVDRQMRIIQAEDNFASNR